MRSRAAALLLCLLAACATGPDPAAVVPQQRNETRPPQLPDSTGWGTHILALERAPSGDLWAGTYAQGLFVLRGDSIRRWQQFMPSAADGSIASKFINSVAAASDSVIWYGSVGDGFGVTVNGGRTWRSWSGGELGRSWVYVAPDGITVRGDTTYIATADGLRITRDNGTTWLCVQGTDRTEGGATPNTAGCSENVHVLPTEYLLALDVGDDGAIWVGHLKGISVSRDGGHSWTTPAGAAIDGQRVRAIAVAGDSSVWAATESGIFVDSTGTSGFAAAAINVPGGAAAGGVRAIEPGSRALPPAFATSFGMIAREVGGQYRIYYLPSGEIYRPSADLWSVVWVLGFGTALSPISGSAAGLNRVLAGETPARPLELVPAAAAAVAPEHVWFRRPIYNEEGNPYIDATYRYGSTMAGNLQQHQGVEFNNPAGTPVHAVADGIVAFAGKAEQGANTVAILHDRKLNGQHVYTTYYHNTELLTQAGQRVRAGDVIARVGNTGRAGNDHLHFEVHVAPTTDSARIVAAGERYPPFTRNPQLWLEPIPGTGIVAGRVLDAAGNPVQGARIHGLVQAYPEETPFSYVETYRDRTRSDPSYNENFAIGDIPPGDYVVGVDIEGKRVWRRVRVQAGLVTFVEFKP